jgi:hypothetical protein
MSSFGYNVLGFGSFPNRAIFATASSASTFNVQTAFGTADYQSGTPKILIIPSGVDLGPMTIPSGMGGTLQVENAGTIRGLGGTAGSAGSGGSGSGGNGGNGGAGGHAITSAHSFDLINTGEISGGGGGSGGSGGGGQGGTGGSGSYTSSSWSSYYYNSSNYYFNKTYNSFNLMTVSIMWAGTLQGYFGGGNSWNNINVVRRVNSQGTPNTNNAKYPWQGNNWGGNHPNTGFQYNPSQYRQSSNSLDSSLPLPWYQYSFQANQMAQGTYGQIRRKSSSTSSSSGGSGGNGGNGGSGAVGQGYGQSAGGANNGSGGSSGSGGGTNAGSGGNGGSGGNSSAGASFGAAGSNGSSGNTGSTGANGNVGNGSAGSSGGSAGSGGAAGKAASFSSGSITIVSNSGTINGATS